MSDNLNHQDSNNFILWLFPAVLSSSSNGHRSMVLMISQLAKQGFQCGILVPSCSRFKRDSTLTLPESIVLFRKDDCPKMSKCIIATDTADASFIDRLRSCGHNILWWLMAPPALLGTPFPKIYAQDSVAIYSSFILPGLSEYCFVQDPCSFQESPDIKTKPHHDVSSRFSPRKLRIGIYCGKARLTLLAPLLEDFLSTTTLISFSRYWPIESHEYFELLDSLDALICFDPLTAVILDFVSRSKPVYLPNNPFPLSSYEDYPLKCLNYVYTDNFKFMHYLQSNADSQNKLLSSIINEIKCANQIGFNLFVKKIDTISSGASNFSDTLSIVDKLKRYVSSLEVISTIDPAIDGQAASGYLLSAYVRLLTLPIPFRVPLRFILNNMISSMDYLAHQLYGKSLLRLILLFPSRMNYLLMRIIWAPYHILAFFYRKIFLPAIRRTLSP